MSTQPLRVLFATGRIASNTLRYRVRMAEEYLRSRGIATQAVYANDPLLTRWVNAIDVLVVYRAPASRRLINAIEKARTRGIPVTFDVDDLVFIPDLVSTIPFLSELSAEQVQQMHEDARLQAEVVRLVDQCTAATQPLVTALRSLTAVPARVLPNGLSPQGARIAAASRRRSNDDVVRLGYFPGSATHNEDWQLIERTVSDIMVRHPDVHLTIMGPLRTGEALEPVLNRVHKQRPVPWRALPQHIAQIDVNLAPLHISPFTEAKSAIKWLEAAVVGTPTIASATQPFREAIDDQQTGLLVAPDGNWHTAIEQLVTDMAERRQMGERAKLAALERYGPEPQADRYEQFITDVIDESRKVVTATQMSLLASSLGRPMELGVDLEPYQVDSDVAHLFVPAPLGAATIDRLRSVTRRGRISARRIRDRGRQLTDRMRVKAWGPD